MRNLEVNAAWEAELAVVEMKGEARLENVRALDRLAQDILRRDVKDVLLDLSMLSFMDSASTGSLLRMHRTQEAVGGKLVLFGMRRFIERLFDRLGVEELHVAVDEAGARERVS